MRTFGGVTFVATLAMLAPTATGASEIGTAASDLVPNWYGGLVLDFPLYQGGLTDGQVRLDVDGARLAVRAAKATVPAADEAATSAREQLRLAEERYATGVGSIIELEDAQVAHTSAAAQVVQAWYGLASARAQLLAALGRT